MNKLMTTILKAPRTPFCPVSLLVPDLGFDVKSVPMPGVGGYVRRAKAKDRGQRPVTVARLPEVAFLQCSLSIAKRQAVKLKTD